MSAQSTATITARTRNVAFYWTSSCRSFVTASGRTFLAPDVAQAGCEYRGSLDGALRAYERIRRTNGTTELAAYLTVGGRRINTPIRELASDWRSERNLASWSGRAPSLTVHLAEEA